MPSSKELARYRERALILFGLALLLLVSPLASWLTQATGRWFTPYLVWLALILLSGWLARRYGERDD